MRHAVYGGNAFTLEKVDRVRFQHVNMWSAPGMGIYASVSSDVHITDSGTCRAPALPMSITADASHFNECRGEVALTRVHFEGQGDDGTNVHGIFHSIRSMQSNGSLLHAVLGSRPAGGRSVLHLGDEYEFRDRRTWEIEGTGVSESPGGCGSCVCMCVIHVRCLSVQVYVHPRACVCVCMCVYVCVRVCMWVCMWVYKRASVYAVRHHHHHVHPTLISTPSLP